MPRYHNIAGQMVQFTTQEEAARDAEEANYSNADDVREQRDQLLAASDAMALADRITDEWRTYRQALRDVPTQTGFPNSVTWPVEPS